MAANSFIRYRMIQALHPLPLQCGHEVRVIAPSRSLSLVDAHVRALAIQRLSALGLKVTFASYAEENSLYYNNGSIAHRVHDLHEAFKDPQVKAILTTLGGYTANQLLAHLDYELIKANPKIFCGFSDITALSNAIYAKTGLVTYSGPHFSSFGMLHGFDYTLEYFKKIFFEQNPICLTSSPKWSNDAWHKDQGNRSFYNNDGMFIINKGAARGCIVGGNLCTLNLLQGTEYMPSLENKILFLEDDALTGTDFLFNFDRDLQSLMHLPSFAKVKGIVLGRAEKECAMSREKWTALIKNKPELDHIPVIGGADFGHTTPFFTFPIGGEVRIEAHETALVTLIQP